MVGAVRTLSVPDGGRLTQPLRQIQSRAGAREDGGDRGQAPVKVARRGEESRIGSEIHSPSLEGRIHLSTS
ncbi:hypothetical protein NDU88_003004 [Pleurodeles waltl]|uniref:Uncharacterized protein n=1 Tax=Pleurodeles waltl TaxID=8319 RepID=A0AAV7UD32_PLEWA|nr:hypothetical protein NDU88_003004 [Pleurodeles waltl]